MQEKKKKEKSLPPSAKVDLSIIQRASHLRVILTGLQMCKAGEMLFVSTFPE